MENSSSRFFKGFSLEDYKLQVLFNTLEKEKKQYLNQLKEQTHVFKMSLRPTVKSGEEYWSQYGENYHANGDKREKDSVTHPSTELKEGQLTLVLPFFFLFAAVSWATMQLPDALIFDIIKRTTPYAFGANLSCKCTAFTTWKDKRTLNIAFFALWLAQKTHNTVSTIQI